MNWEAIGAVGEIVGASAVFVTLIYLSVQLRSSARATRANTAQALTESINEGNRAIAGNSELARIYRIGKFEGMESLTEDEMFSWGYVAVATCRSLEAVFTHERLKQADPESVLLAKDTVRQLFSSTGYKQWWQEGHSKLAFTKDFVDFVERECIDAA